MASEFAIERLFTIYPNTKQLVQFGCDAANAALIISDAVDGVIHNAARRGALGDSAIENELIRLVSLYLADDNKLPAAHGMIA